MHFLDQQDFHNHILGNKHDHPKDLHHVVEDVVIALNLILISFSKVDNRKHLGNWKRQEKFVSQCELLALRGKWWGVLQRHNIKFDPHHFDESRNKPCEQREKRSSKAGGGYVASLLSPLISNLYLYGRSRIDFSV